ncbi:MAG: 1-deoxy-D-xylulose-5-phosphate reductoisomerase [Rhodospirillaceae bacterium]|nr:1-deoxy-D-xylulose-5-phosphate reductoisomerase [Rhodospirillaceae bacterium]
MALTSPAPRTQPRRITILGATGSIGRNTVELIERQKGAYAVEALTAHRDVARLADQARRLGARRAVVADPAFYVALKAALSGSGVEAAAGPEALTEAAAMPAEWVMSAIVGVAGLAPTLAAVRRGAVVALANKECLVSAGPVMTSEIKRHGATLLPVDSEHNAIFQVFDAVQPEAVERIYLTASGGPFRTLQHDAMAGVTPSQALAHPTWTMGAKISVDSATMMNKGLELIEAHYLFPVGKDRIEILVHPQSVVHGLVAMVDGSILAQMGSPDMRTPIAYALGWPRRMPAPSARLDLAKLGQLTFEAPDPARFPALRVARDALHQGGGAPTILNAANEVAVQGFLAGRVGFLDIVRVVERCLETVESMTPGDLVDVQALDEEARLKAAEVVIDVSRQRTN